MADKIEKTAEELAKTLYGMGYYKFADSEISGMAPASEFISDIGQPIQNTFSGISVVAVGYVDEKDLKKIFVYAPRVSKKIIRSFPDVIGGYPTALANFGNIDVRPESAITASNRPKCFQYNGRIACGSSAAPSGAGYAGTFGAIVKRNNTFYALSNNHVFGGCNHTTIGHPILSPSADDTGPGLPYPKTLFTHSEFAPLHSGDPLQMSPSKLDASIAQIVSMDSVSSLQGTYYDTPTKWIEPHAGLKVKKVGRTTGLTSGIIESKVAGFLPLPYKADKFRATVYLVDVWFIRGNDGDDFGGPGDSGSLVVAEDGTAAVGLLFAVTSLGLSVIIPIDTVLKYFNVSLVNGIGVG